METCTDCGARATCRYDYGTGLRYGCAAHDPLRPFIAATVRVPPFYQSLPFFTLATAGPGFALWCTCVNGLATAVCPIHPPARPMAVC